jgi:glycosyltransferase involved in cell wall biosynthesis
MAAGNKRGDGMTKILHVITSTQTGGAENHLLALATALFKEGWISEVAYLKGREDLNQRFIDRGIPVYPLHLRPWFDMAALRRLVRLIRNRRPDIIHAHLFPAEVYATAAATLSGGRARLICTKHNDDDFLRRPHFKLLHRLISHSATRTIAISEHVRRYTLTIGTADPSRVVTIPYGYDGGHSAGKPPGLRKEFGIGNGTFLIGSVGRLAPQKGQRYLLEAVQKMVAAGEDAALVLVGEGPLLGSLKAQVAASGLERRVFFAGFRSEVRDLMPEFDVFALPSLWEGFGLVLLEAMAAGRAIVASRVSAIPEVVEDGVTGFLVPPGDSDALAEALVTLRRDGVKRERLGIAGAERLRRQFTLERMVERTIEVYRAVLDESGSSSRKA